MYPHTPPYATIPLFQRARRTYLACLRCRKRKIKCLSGDENTPCERCSRRGLDRTQGPRKVMGRPATKTAHQHQSIRENGLNINLNSLRAGTAVPPTMTKSIHQVAQGRYTADTILYLNYNFPSAAPVLYTPSVARHQLIKEHALKLYHFSLAALVIDTCTVVSMQSVLRRQAIKEDILKLKRKFPVGPVLLVIRTTGPITAVFKVGYFLRARYYQPNPTIPPIMLDILPTLAFPHPFEDVASGRRRNSAEAEYAGGLCRCGLNFWRTKKSTTSESKSGLRVWCTNWRNRYLKSGSAAFTDAISEGGSLEPSCGGEEPKALGSLRLRRAAGRRLRSRSAPPRGEMEASARGRL
ncbi:hypothetical protein DFH09DRAFT_1102482 [Mycena vulgaris]|nr:hypothetical protein DFH09DRAFT_1102482 [Mycena vulgaris]